MKKIKLEIIDKNTAIVMLSLNTKSTTVPFTKIVLLALANSNINCSIEFKMPPKRKSKNINTKPITQPNTVNQIYLLFPTSPVNRYKSRPPITNMAQLKIKVNNNIKTKENPNFA